MYQIVKGEPIQVIQRNENELSNMDPNRSGLSSLKPSNNERERNLTDADKEFIAEIEEYIKNLGRLSIFRTVKGLRFLRTRGNISCNTRYLKSFKVKHVNQAYLLKQLSLDQKAMLALMKNNSYTDESLEEYHKFNNLQFGCFEFEQGEFEPQKEHLGFGKGTFSN